MRNRQITVPLVLTRILHRLWDEGCMKDVTYLTEAYFPDDDTVQIRGYSEAFHKMQWRVAFWDKDWDIDGR